MAECLGSPACRLQRHGSCGRWEVGSMRASGSAMSATGLISAVRRRRALWDPTNPQHHRRALVAGLWRQVGSEVGVHTVTAKSKWRGLRDYYRQQLRRTLDSGPPSHWAHFEEMAFLAPSMSSSKPIKMEEEAAAEPEDESWGWAQEESEEDDDDLLFFRSLLPDLRGLSRQRKAWIRLQIQQVVFQEVYSGRKSPSEKKPPAHCLSPLQNCKAEVH